MGLIFATLLFLFVPLGSCPDPDGTEGPHVQRTFPDGPVVDTPLGSVRGRTYSISKTGGVVGAFLGLPYAEPPINDLRFRPPVKLESWGQEEGVRDGTQFGSICIQPGEQKIWDVVQKSGRGMVRKRKLEQYPQSEDCLTLNIFVPLDNGNSTTIAGGEARSVLFFIHGGSYYMNGGRLYPGQVLASTQNLVVVTFNYRLGPLGFFSTGDQAAPGNYGLLDQNLALDWVIEYISFFGGDKNRITLVGNSAGGASVMFHMFSPLSKGKFVGVTVQSGCSGAPWAIQHNPRKHAEALAEKLRCPTSPSHDLVECVRTFSPQVIMKNAKLEDGLSLAFATVIDGKYGGKFLPDHPDALIKAKAFYSVPFLTGFTRDEVTIWFTKFGPTTKTKDLRSFVQVDVISLLENVPTVTDANMAAMIHSVTVQYLYRSGIKENDTLGKTSAVSDFISDVGLKAPCIKELNTLSHHATAPIYLYEFHYFSVDDFKMGRQEWIGAYHESELQYLFGEPYLNYSNHLRSFDDKRMADLVMKLWGNFIRTGNPTPKGDRTLKFSWNNYTEHNQEFAVLSLKSHLDKFYLTDRMLFWNFFFPIFRDYSFKFDGGKDCGSWMEMRGLWVLWVLVGLVIVLLAAFALALTCHVRTRIRSYKNGTAHNPPEVNSNVGGRQQNSSNNLPLMPRL